MTIEPQHDTTDAVHGVVRHLVRCEPCRESLAHLESRDAALAFLTAQRSDPRTTTIERVFAGTATAGEKVLADLLYELAKACLLSDAEFARLVKPHVAPREIDVVEAQLRALVPAVVPRNDSLAACGNAVEQVLVEGEDVRRTALSLIKVLRGLEGVSVRSTTLEGQWLIQCGHCRDALSMLQAVVDDPSVPVFWRNVAASGYARAALMLDDFQKIETLVSKAEHGGFSSPLIELFGVASSAVLGMSDSARARLEALKRPTTAWPDAERGPGILLSSFVSEHLGLEPSELRVSVGVTS